MSAVFLVLPSGTDDPAHPSGGHRYNRRLCQELAVLGWSVRETQVAGGWPDPDRDSFLALSDALRGLPDGAIVVIDGLVASAAPAAVLPEAKRLAFVVLVHLPLGEQFPGHPASGHDEEAVLRAARAVITTSRWTRDRLLGRYRLGRGSVKVATPGTAPGAIASGTADGGELLCVATVQPHKGHDVLLDALAPLADRGWRCRLVGALDRDPVFVARLRSRARAAGIGDRIGFAGPLAGAALDRAYAGADVLVSASLAESYGMVVTEALAHGVPVLGGAAGGLPEALGTVADGRRPGLLVPAGDDQALSAALACWLDDPGLRHRLRMTARERRAALPSWSGTAGVVGRVLTALESSGAGIGGAA